MIKNGPNMTPMAEHSAVLADRAAQAVSEEPVLTLKISASISQIWKASAKTARVSNSTLAIFSVHSSEAAGVAEPRQSAVRIFQSTLKWLLKKLSLVLI